MHVAAWAGFGDAGNEFHDDVCDLVDRDAFELSDSFCEVWADGVADERAGALFGDGDAASPCGLDEVAQCLLRVGESWFGGALADRCLAEGCAGLLQVGF